MKLGVIGGLGPMATARFMEMVIDMTEAQSDQEHVEMIIYNCPHIPDRTSYILGKSQSNPLPAMVEVGQKLASQGVGCIAIPCITAHYFYNELTRELPVPIIPVISETAKELRQKGITCAGIMATDGTVQSGIFQSRLEAAGIKALLPDSENQQAVMDIIYKNVKAGLPVDMESFRRVSEHLRQKGAQAIILGCTELSLVSRQNPIGSGYIDAMEVLAQRAVLRCGGKLKEKYKSLITA